jgi:AraC-like DNA-binding protein
MMVGSSTLYNKLRALTGQNIIGFITSIRLKEAYRILKENPHIPIQELSIKVGFNTPQYFSKCFKKAFHILPKDFTTKNK